MPQIYEVTLVVEKSRATQFESYMADEHVPDVLATGCFTSACFARAEAGKYVSGYNVNTPEDLQRYLDKHAAALRDDVIQHFGDSVQTSRRVLDVIKLFAAE